MAIEDQVPFQEAHHLRRRIDVVLVPESAPFVVPLAVVLRAEGQGSKVTALDRGSVAVFVVGLGRPAGPAADKAWLPADIGQVVWVSERFAAHIGGTAPARLEV